MARSRVDADRIVPEAIGDLDADIAAEVETVPDSAAGPALKLVSKLGDQPPMRVLCGATIAIGLVSGNARLVRAGLRMIVAHSLATGMKNVVKERFDRTRPNARRHDDDHRVRRGESSDHSRTSFPSGHSAGAVAVAAAFAREYPEHKVAVLGGAVAVAAAQVPRGSHYASDVVVGSAIGALSEAALHIAIETIAPRSGKCADGETGPISR